MSSTAETLSRPDQASGRYGALDRVLRKRLLATLDGLRGGQLAITEAFSRGEASSAWMSSVPRTPVRPAAFHRSA